MSQRADVAARTQRFNEAVRTFTPPAPTRHARLTPMKDDIIELRRKGVSLRLIRELLATVDVAVGTDTIARFPVGVNGETAPQRSSKRSGRRRVGIPKLTYRQPDVAPPVAEQFASTPPHGTAVSKDDAHAQTSQA